MAHVLYIEASPRKQRSASIEVANAFLDAYREAHPGDSIEKLDLWANPLPELDGAMLDARYAIHSGTGHSDDQAAAWQSIRDLAGALHRADKIVVSTPMWNFGIPYKLKHWIDIITQPGITFAYDPSKGYFGLVTGKRALVIYAQGGDYAEGSPAAAMDMQTRYLRQALNFIGISDQITLAVSRGLYGPDADRASRQAAAQQARELAAQF